MPTTDTLKPATIAMPPDDNLALYAKWVQANYVPFMKGLIAESGADVIIDPALVPPDVLTMPLRVDGHLVVVDFNDYCVPHGPAWGYRHWLSFYTMSNLLAYTQYANFTVPSFHNWDLYRKVREEVRYTAKSDIVLNNQILLHDATDYRNTRRNMLHRALQPIRARVDITRRDQETFFRKAGNCLCYVHSPGSWINMLDRTPLQMMAFGVCVVQPAIFTLIGEVRPRDKVHYLACADDYSDVLDVIAWCADHREECVEIGDNARRLFEEHAMPGPTWARVVRRINRTDLDYKGRIVQ